ncbi:MAG: MotA/TolQ/ExbB proton channel family protein, partial [Xanthomonadales bacterium]|nr:MotA/TolQ/ExbB proton channel family protein [Xanthomonadales bacterium]
MDFLYYYLPFLETIRDFFELGGPVLRVIGLLTLFMWILIIERLLYFRTSHPALIRRALAAWNARKDHSSWKAHAIRTRIISQISALAERNIALIQTCVALCPLLGLLGTVTGMIEVFDVMAVAGSGNAKAMAGGVSKATIPTMA